MKYRYCLFYAVVLLTLNTCVATKFMSINSLLNKIKKLYKSAVSHSESLSVENELKTSDSLNNKLLPLSISKSLTQQLNSVTKLQNVKIYNSTCLNDKSLISLSKSSFDEIIKSGLIYDKMLHSNSTSEVMGRLAKQASIYFNKKDKSRKTLSSKSYFDSNEKLFLVEIGNYNATSSLQTFNIISNFVNCTKLNHDLSQALNLSKDSGANISDLKKTFANFDTSNCNVAKSNNLTSLAEFVFNLNKTEASIEQSSQKYIMSFEVYLNVTSKLTKSTEVLNISDIYSTFRHDLVNKYLGTVVKNVFIDVNVRERICGYLDKKEKIDVIKESLDRLQTDLDKLLEQINIKQDFIQGLTTYINILNVVRVDLSLISRYYNHAAALSCKYWKDQSQTLEACIKNSQNLTETIQLLIRKHGLNVSLITIN